MRDERKRLNVLPNPTLPNLTLEPQDVLGPCISLMKGLLVVVNECCYLGASHLRGVLTYIFNLIISR